MRRASAVALAAVFEIVIVHCHGGLRVLGSENGQRWGGHIGGRQTGDAAARELTAGNQSCFKVDLQTPA